MAKAASACRVYLGDQDISSVVLGIRMEYLPGDVKKVNVIVLLDRVITDEDGVTHIHLEAPRD